MSKIFGIAGLVILMVLLHSCGVLRHGSQKTDSVPGTWQQTPVTIDGDAKDWPSPYPNYDAKAMVAYATSNDNENLYITMETGDEMTQMKILKQGLIVSIDTGGHKSPQFNINFPLPGDIDLTDIPGSSKRMKKDNGRYEDKQRIARLAKYAKDANQFSLDGFATCNGAYVVRQTTPCGIKVALAMDEYNELVWEAVIPFKAIYNKSAITATDGGKPISVCFHVKGFKRTEPKNNSDNNNAGSMNTGMGTAGSNSRMRGGGTGGNSRPNQSDDPMQQLYETTRTWKFFSLAFNQ